MNRLHVPEGSPWWLFAAANLILLLHIAGGSVAIVSGTVALLTRKGKQPHRMTGTLFVAAMLVMATIGAIASPFLPVPEMANVVAGVMTAYLVVTGWATVSRAGAGMGWIQTGGAAVALAITVAGAIFIVLAKASPSGTIGNTPPQAFYVFVIVGALAAAGDLRLIRRGRIAGPARLARHLWRMCAALFIASGSFFLGQQRIMPVYMQGSPWLFIPVIAPLLLMIFWLIRVRITRADAGKAGSAGDGTDPDRKGATLNRYVIPALVVAVFASPVLANDDAMVNCHGNTRVSTGGSATIRMHYRVDHTFDFVGSMMHISRTFSGTWELDHKRNICRTCIGHLPPDSQNPGCSPIVAHELGEVRKSKDGARTLTLKPGVQ